MSGVNDADDRSDDEKDTKRVAASNARQSKTNSINLDMSSDEDSDGNAERKPSMRDLQIDMAYHDLHHVTYEGQRKKKSRTSEWPVSLIASKYAHRAWRVSF
jgi:hypothetical protein